MRRGLNAFDGSAAHRPVVLKFGSSLLDGPDGFKAAAREAAREVGLGRRVLCVCSARRGATDALLRDAHTVSRRPSPSLVGRLLATGESASAALLALALEDEGVAAHALDTAALGLRTRGDLLDAEPVGVDGAALRALLACRPALVVPGFLGIHETGETSLLGRGGSDLTALFLAHHVQALECRLLKDVDGLFPADPAVAPAGRPLRHASFAVARALGGRLVQLKALEFARERNLTFRVAAPGGSGTWIGGRREVTP